MVRFKKLRWKNFLSTGNAWNEINFEAAKTSLIVGANGSGKSTVLDALCFVLFGKPFRNINKPQLLNSVNQKNLEVEIEFDVGSREYRVVRGIKPGVFEIYQAGVLLNQDASIKDYQSVLEDQILNYNYKTFTQIVVLGSASFIPFMQLRAADRREIVEDLLDIRIFSGMNKILKDEHDALIVELRNLENTIEIAKKQVSLHKQYIDVLSTDREAKITGVQDQITSTTNDMTTLLDSIAENAKQIVYWEDMCTHEQSIKDQLKENESKLSKVKLHLEAADKDIAFFTENDNCSTCQQSITQEFRLDKVGEQAAHKEALRVDKSLIEDIISVLETEITAINGWRKNVTELKTQNVSLNAQVSAATTYIKKMQGEIAKLKEADGNIDDERIKFRDGAQNVVDLLQRRAEINEERQYFNVASVMLKDTGIKTSIIREYLPIINKLVNKYLQTMDLFINFELDEAFNETLKSRYRDEFTYASFSEGEKQRINLSLLFAWRDIAKLRNTTNSNLLLFDEVLDGSLDATAVEYFLNLITELNSNIVVITHKQDLFVDKFDRVIKVAKVGGYSIMDGGDK